jgi:hypothetical protein
MGGDGHPAKSLNVFDDIARFASQRVRRARQTYGHDVNVRSSDLDRVDTKHAIPIRRGVRLAGAIPVIGDDHELQSGS